MIVCIIGAGDAGATAANQVRRLDREAQIDSSYSPHVQEDQIAVPLHQLIDKLESGGG
jgi:predicted dinucleotide-binding enzyme